MAKIEQFPRRQVRPLPDTIAWAASGDLSNARLAAVVAVCLVVACVAAVVIHALPDRWGRPGDPILQTAAAAGTVLLLAGFAAVFAKRFRRPGKRAFHGHVWLTSIGTALVLAHGAAGLDRPPALLLALLALLIGLGIWSRTAGAAAMARTFGEKRAGFRPADPTTRERLRAILDRKRILLRRIDAGAEEEQFSLEPLHWVRAPLAALRYRLLAHEERELTAARTGLSPLLARWRFLHRLAGFVFVVGLFAHVLIVMVFAGYAAHGDTPYWFHFAAWDF